MLKFRDAVNVPHKKAGVARKNITKMQPKKTLGKVARGTGIGVTALTEFVLWLTKYAVFDNQISRGLENKFSKIKPSNDKKIPAFLNKKPELSSYLVWWMIVALAIGGGSLTYNKVQEKNEQKKEYAKRLAARETLGDYVEYMRPITPLLVADLIAKEGVHVNKDGMHVVYDDKTGKTLSPGEKPKGNPTIGFGSTVLKDGSRVTSYTPPITNEEAYELARWHLEQRETYFGMYCYDVGCENVDIDDIGMAFGIGSIMYNSFSNLIEPKDNNNCKNRFGHLRQMYKDNGLGLTKEMVRQCFNDYPINKLYSFGGAFVGGESRENIANTLSNFIPEGRGMWWRRWLEAGLITGDITPQMMLNCPIHGMYEFFAYMGEEKTAFWKNGKANKDTYAIFKQWIERPVDKYNNSLSKWKKTRDYLPDYALALCNENVCKLGGERTSRFKEIEEKIERETYVFNFDSAYNAATNAFKKQRYVDAAEMYDGLIKIYPDNALLRNDLAATYNKLGKYNDAIRQTNEVLKRIDDKSQYSAAWYNAGFAYEQQGKLQKALAKYKLAVANGNKRVAKDVERVTNEINAKKTKKGRNTAYTTANKKIQNNINTSGFMRGVLNLHNKDMV